MLSVVIWGAAQISYGESVQFALSRSQSMGEGERQEGAGVRSHSRVLLCRDWNVVHCCLPSVLVSLHPSPVCIPVMSSPTFHTFAIVAWWCCEIQLESHCLQARQGWHVPLGPCWPLTGLINVSWPSMPVFEQVYSWQQSKNLMSTVISKILVLSVISACQCFGLNQILAQFFHYVLRIFVLEMSVLLYFFVLISNCMFLCISHIYLSK